MVAAIGLKVQLLSADGLLEINENPRLDGEVSRHRKLEFGGEQSGDMDNKDDLTAIPDLLERLQPGYLPQKIFHAITRLVVTPTFVVIPLFYCEQKILVHLTRRDSDDPHYANLLHPPGTVLQATDQSLNEAYERLAQTELNGLRLIGSPVFVDVFYEQIKRGREISLVHWIALECNGDREGFYDSETLPADIVPTDITRIEKAVRHFRRQTDLEMGNL